MIMKTSLKHVILLMGMLLIVPTTSRPSNQLIEQEKLSSKPKPNSTVCEFYNCTGRNCTPTKEICPQSNGVGSHCYAVYNSSVVSLNGSPRPHLISKGCWQQDSSCSLTADCRLKPTRFRGIEFCCCTGDMCNRHVASG